MEFCLGVFFIDIGVQFLDTLFYADGKFFGVLNYFIFDPFGVPVFNRISFFCLIDAWDTLSFFPNRRDFQQCFSLAV